MIMVWRNPELAPPLPRVPMHERLVSLKTGLPIIIIFIVVIRGHLRRHVHGHGRRRHRRVHDFALVMGRLSWSIVTNGLNDTGKTISMAFTVLGGAGVFSYFMTMSKIPMILAGVIASMNMPPMAVMFAIIVCMSLLGCFIPAIPLMLICVPIFLPLAALFGWNLIWFRRHHQYPRDHGRHDPALWRQPVRRQGTGGCSALAGVPLLDTLRPCVLPVPRLLYRL